MKISLASRNNIFNDDEIDLKHKNFIFGKNGTGKSTLCDLIMKEKHFAKVEYNSIGKLVEVLANGEKVLVDNQDDKYNVHLFQGFESVIGEDNNLNAIALSGENKRVVDELKIAEKELENLINEQNKLEKDLVEAQSKFKKQNDKIDKWRKSASKSIKEDTQYQVDANYNKTKFEKDIIKAKRVDNINELSATITEKPKEVLEPFEFDIPDIDSLLTEINIVLSKTVKFSVKCDELDEVNKEQFAKSGIELHEEGQNCLFCGGTVTKERLDKLNQHFNQEYRNLEKEINNVKLDGIKLKELDQNDFYAKFEVAEINQKIQSIEKNINNNIEVMKKVIMEKQNDITKVFEKISLDIPNITSLQKEINDLIDKNNKFGENLNHNIEKAKIAIKYHLVQEQCDIFDYQSEISELENLEKGIPDLSKINNLVLNKLEEIQNLKDQQKDTTKIAKMINERLSRSGKIDLQLAKIESEGIERYEIHDGENTTRPISQVSTGEKNIISFLYFIFSLEDIENTNNKKKIIIFDDPMNSNDDTMQYLMITELQKIYQGKEPAKFNPSRDYFLCLTHNVHFYLNIQPHGNFKDKNDLTKYDKNNFYRIENKRFKLIKNEKEDFKTSYAGLWIELQELCKNNYKFSILNSMRRIIETFMKFNNIPQDIFYGNNEQYLKLFNVNSHSIDDLDHELFTESSEELKELFRQIFVDNGFKDHFNNYWTE